MDERLTSIWVYLAETPLLWLTLTVAIYQGATMFWRRTGSLPLLNPVLLAIIVLVALLTLTGTNYETYFDGAQFVHFLLGPATVALAVPLYLYQAKLRQMLIPVLGALVVGSTTAVLSVIALSTLLGVSDETMRSMIPKSITTPIDMGVSQTIGGLPSLTAVLVIITGIVGASVGNELLAFCRVRDLSIRGFAIGVSSHGIGTARALQVDEEAGAFSGLAMGLNGAVTALLVPLLLRLLGL